MCESYFRHENDDYYTAASITGGPWDPTLQHGGPPSALLVHAAEEAAAAAGRTEVTAIRYAAEFLGPVPVGTVQARAEVVRAARSAVLVDADLSAAGRTCLHARIWLAQHADTADIAPARDAERVPDGLPDVAARFPYGESIEWRALRGSLAEPGPGTTWARPRVPLLPERRMTGLQRAVLIGDSASGLSGELDWNRWTFLNVDLDVHLARPVAGEWVLMEAATQLGPTGTALARGTLSDVTGPVGSTAQTLLLARRANSGGTLSG
jgi:hypothetical protein